MVRIVTRNLHSWDATPCSPHLDVDRGQGCPRCGAWLTIHQPDSLNPDRLLGTCTLCQSWFYIDVTPDGSAALLIHLPEAASCWQAAETMADRHDPGPPPAEAMSTRLA